MENLTISNVKENLKEAIENFFKNRKGILQFLSEKNKIKDLGHDISLWSSECNWQIKPGKIDKRTKKNNLDFLNIEKFTIFETILKIRKELVDKWLSSGKKSSILEGLGFSNLLECFSDSLECFILEKLCDFSNSVDSLEKIVFHNAVIDLIYHQKENSSIKFSLISDSETLNWGKNTYYDNGKTVKEGIEKSSDIKEWSDITFKAENIERVNNLIVAIPNNGKHLLLIEESPVNIQFNKDQIYLYWLGALKVGKKPLRGVKWSIELK